MNCDSGISYRTGKIRRVRGFSRGCEDWSCAMPRGASWLLNSPRPHCAGVKQKKINIRAGHKLRVATQQQLPAPARSVYIAHFRSFSSAQFFSISCSSIFEKSLHHFIRIPWRHPCSLNQTTPDTLKSVWLPVIQNNCLSVSHAAGRGGGWWIVPSHHVPDYPSPSQTIPYETIAENNTHILIIFRANTFQINYEILQLISRIFFSLGEMRLLIRGEWRENGAERRKGFLIRLMSGQLRCIIVNLVVYVGDFRRSR